MPDESTAIVSVQADSLLATILNEAAESGGLNLEGQREFVVENTLEVPQTKGQRHQARQVFHLYAGPREVADGTYAKYIDFALVDVLYDQVPDGKWVNNRGGRQMWGYKNDSGKWERDLEAGGPACSSPNGIAPRPEFLGKEIIDIRTGESVKIGFTDGVPVTGEVMGTDMKMHVQVCKTCPLGQWRTDEATGKRQPPPCADAHGYVVYIFPHDDESIPVENRITEGFLAIIRGQNSGVQLALPGARAGTPAARIDGAAFMGIVAPFRPNPDTRDAIVVRHAGEVGDRLIERIVGFCQDENQTGFVAAKMRGADGRPNELFTKLRNNTEQFPYVAVKVPTYSYAPQGLPEEAGGSVPLKRVEMHVAENGYKLGSRANPTLVPEIVVSDRPLSIQHYAEYLKARTHYRNAGGRDQLMRTDLLAISDDALRTGILPEISTDDAPVVQDDLAV